MSLKGIKLERGTVSYTVYSLAQFKVKCYVFSRVDSFWNTYRVFRILIIANMSKVR